MARRVKTIQISGKIGEGDIYMRLCNIFPIKNQRFYKDEKYVMILAHLLNLYSPQYFHKDQFVILDNGLYENAQVSTDLRDLIKIAQESSIHINEIVIPDKFFFFF